MVALPKSLGFGGIDINVEKFIVFFIPSFRSKPRPSIFGNQANPLDDAVSSLPDAGNFIPNYNLKTAIIGLGLYPILSEDVPDEYFEEIPIKLPFPFPMEINKYVISWETTTQITSDVSTIMTTESALTPTAVNSAGVPYQNYVSPTNKLNTIRSKVSYSKSYHFEIQNRVEMKLLLSTLEALITDNQYILNNSNASESSKQPLKALIVDGLQVPVLLDLGDIQKSYQAKSLINTTSQVWHNFCSINCAQFKYHIVHNFNFILLVSISSC